MSNWISREEVLAIIDKRVAYNVAELQLDKAVFNELKLLRKEINELFSFPDPNPRSIGLVDPNTGERDDRNVMGQTEEEFWDAVEREDK